MCRTSRISLRIEAFLGDFRARAQLDVRHSKLITPTVPINRLDTMLRAEAAYWVSAWSDLS